MLNLWLPLISVIVATNAEHFIVDNYNVTIQDSTLKSVRRTSSNSSTDLNLSNFNLRYIDEGAFSDNLEIKNLSLANNELRYLHPYVFRSLRDNLQHLSLTNTTIMNLLYIFGGLKNLKTLDIRDNMPRLTTGSFHGLSNGVEILADDKVLLSILPEHFKNPFPLLTLCVVDGIVRSLEIFDDNHDERDDGAIENECVLKIRPLIGAEVRIAREGITGVAKGWYRIRDLYVRSLNLQSNEIQNITGELMNDLPTKLRKINLSYNKIAILKNDVIDNLNLRALNLRKNMIAKIENDALANTKNLRIYLHGNELPVSELAVNLNAPFRIYNEGYSSCLLVNNSQ